MAELIEFPSITANAGLPLLFSGQAQKEFTVNQALVTLDALLLRTVEASLDSPPADPEEGQAYRVLAGATGEWEGYGDKIAVSIGASWHFVAPKAGLKLYDISARQTLIYKTRWEQPVAPENPQGGAVVDVELRAAVAGLIDALRMAGIFADSP